LIDLQRTAEGCSQYDGALEQAVKREAEGAAKYDSIKTLHKNLIHLSTMSDRFDNPFHFFPTTMYVSDFLVTIVSYHTPTTTT
jgi:hypothetical protein